MRKTERLISQINAFSNQIIFWKMTIFEANFCKQSFIVDDEEIPVSFVRLISYMYLEYIMQ